MNENKDLIEEVFCLKFELNTLSSVLIKNETERWVSGFMFGHIEKDHIDRYIWSYNYVSGKKVLDIACGIGKGSYMIATSGNADEVMGCDLNAEAIRYARHRNSNSKIQFRVQDALLLEWQNEYDTIVSFETIEHVSDVDLFLSKIALALKDKGVFLVSTPISDKSVDNKPDNPYHFQEWGFQSFQEKVSEFFNIEEVYLQLYNQIPMQKRDTLLDKIRTKIFGVKKKVNAGTNKSKIEKYTKQYSIDEIGTSRRGYQLVVCKKK